MTSGDDIFVLDNRGQLTPLRHARYESEDLLQRLLEDHADLLAGSQMNPGSPRRWLLVGREHGVPVEEQGPARWSLDHLFLDQDGLPTLVEVKRSTDTRIRREVVGQMLDYAANGVRYWPAESLRAQFAHTMSADPAAADLAVEGFAEGLSADQFWHAVGDHLQAGRMRLLFVADEIPAELRRIIEFLNEQMARVEVLGVEVRQYVGGDLRTLVPRVIGMTAASEVTKGRSPEVSYEEWLTRAAPETREVERRLLEWAAEHQLEVRRTPVSTHVLARRRRPLAVFFPRLQTVDIYLEPLRRAGESDTADAVLARIVALIGRTPGDKYPNLTAYAIATQWDAFASEVLGPMLDAYRNSPEAT
jgi:hypothetical protein